MGDPLGSPRVAPLFAAASSPTFIFPPGSLFFFSNAAAARLASAIHSRSRGPGSGASWGADLVVGARERENGPERGPIGRILTRNWGSTGLALLTAPTGTERASRAYAVAAAAPSGSKVMGVGSSASLRASRSPA